MSQRYLKDAAGFVYAYTEVLAEQPGMKELTAKEVAKVSKGQPVVDEPAEDAAPAAGAE